MAFSQLQHEAYTTFLYHISTELRAYALMLFMKFLSPPEVKETPSCAVAVFLLPLNDNSGSHPAVMCDGYGQFGMMQDVWLSCFIMQDGIVKIAGIAGGLEDGFLGRKASGGVFLSSAIRSKKSIFFLLLFCQDQLYESRFKGNTFTFYQVNTDVSHD